MILDELVKSSGLNLDESETKYDSPDNFNSIDRAITDLEAILADLKSIKNTENIHGSIRYSIKADLEHGSYKRNVKGKVTL